jgi:uncharacterized SAM-binding protein YcdF (DUF218 family)
MWFPFKVFLSPVFILVFLISMGTLLAKRRPTLAKFATITGLSLLWIATTKPIVDLIAAPLEFAYPKYASQPVEHIWVLGCNHSDSQFLPDYNRLEPCSQARMLEAVRIWQQNPTATLHLSGELRHRQFEHSAVASAFAQQLGVPAAQIQRYPQALNTRQEAELVAPKLLSLSNNTPNNVALVTSAMHMTRAMRWAKANGLTPLAAPTDFTIRRDFAEHQLEGWVPNQQALIGFSYAQYEYFGLVAQWFSLRH